MSGSTQRKPDSTIGQPMNRAEINRNRWKLVGIFAIAVVPVVLAFTMYFAGFAIPQGKTNKGQLLWPPVELGQSAIPALRALTPTGEESGKWSLMLSGRATCDADCEARLHEIRQVNVAMGRESERVGRILASDVSPEQSAALKAHYPALQVVSVSPENLAQFETQAQQVGAASTAHDEWQVWLIDPLGNVILQYGPQQDGYDMMADLKRLLKLSKIG